MITIGLSRILSMCKNFTVGFLVGEETVYIGVVSRKEEVYRDYSGMTRNFLHKTS